MRDDFQIPNVGQAPNSYDVSYFNRMVRNIEQTFNLIRTVGQGIFDKLTTNTLTVNTDMTVVGNQTVGGNQTVTGNETVTGTLGVTGATTLAGLSAGTSGLGNTTVTGTLSVTGATTLAAPSKIGANRIITVADVATETAAGIAEVATVAEVQAGTDDGRMITPLKLASLRKWETIYDGAVASSTTFPVLNLAPFRDIRFIGYLIPTTTASVINATFSTTNGASYITTGYASHFMYMLSNAATVTAAQATAQTAALLTTNNTVSPVATNLYGFNFDLLTAGFNKVQYSPLRGLCSWFRSVDSTVLDANVSHYNGSTAAFNAIQFSSPNAFQGYMTIEGIRG